MDAKLSHATARSFQDWLMPRILFPKTSAMLNVTALNTSREATRPIDTVLEFISLRDQHCQDIWKGVKTSAVKHDRNLAFMSETEVGVKR